MSEWFEDNSQYVNGEAVPDQLQYPHLSLVSLYPNGKTQPVWGAASFVDNQKRGKFRSDVVINRFNKQQMPFGIVMRSLPMICVDVDGKNGGIQTAALLGLTNTFGERSKSQNGYHLYYSIPYTRWNPERGYDEFPDIIGLIPGVDIKGTGVVFHYGNQLWNSQDVAIAPASLLELIGKVRDIKRQTRLTKSGVSDMDSDELVIIHDELRERLASKFEPGKRNTKLYAIGSQMQAAFYPAWDIALYDRGIEIGLEIEEITDIINNIEKYSS